MDRPVAFIAVIAVGLFITFAMSANRATRQAYPIIRPSYLPLTARSMPSVALPLSSRRLSPWLGQATTYRRRLKSCARGNARTPRP